jgi:RNA polymerase sigma-70 factor, ECF subfamily
LHIHSCQNMSDVRALPDQELLSLVRKGDQKAFSELFDRYWSPLFVQACKVVKEADEAADLVQDVFVYLWDKREIVDVRSNLLAYLSRAVRYRFLDMLDKKKVRLDYINSLSLFMESGRAITEEHLRERELLRIIDELIEQLPPKQKQAYVMSRKSNMSTAEIAIALNVSEKTVQNQISLALKDLKLKLTALQLSGVLLGSELFSEILKKI